MQLPEKDMIVLRLGIPPVYGRKIRFYEEKDMVALTKIPPPPCRRSAQIRRQPRTACASSRRPKRKRTPSTPQDRRLP
jgi:type IV secretory pathway TraG/TraD family ATPase VirD4